MAMMDYEKLIEKLEDENKRVDISPAQKEVNLHRINWIKLVNRPKPPVDQPYTPLNPIVEKIKNSNFQLNPNALLRDKEYS